MTEAPRAPIGFDPEQALRSCRSAHCVGIIKALLDAGHRETAACTAERQISAAAVPQEDSDKYKGLRKLIAGCPFGQAILDYYHVIPSA